MGIYLGTNALGGGGGGSGIPINSYGTFHSVDHSGITGPYTDESNNIWLKTGEASLDTTTYPDADSGYVVFKNYSYNTGLGDGGGTPYTGGGFLFHGSKLILINGYNNTFWRFNTYTIDLADYSVTAQGGVQYFNNAYLPSVNFNGVNLTWEASRAILTAASTSVGFSIANGDDVQNEGVGNPQYVPNSSVAASFSGYPLNLQSDGSRYLLYSSFLSPQPRSVLVDLNGVTASTSNTSGNIGTAQVLGSFDGYACLTGNTFWTIEGSDEFSAVTTTIAKERTLSTGALTGNTVSFPNITTTVADNAQTNAFNMTLVTQNGTGWYHHDSTVTTGLPASFDVIAPAIGDSVAKFVYLATSEVTGVPTYTHGGNYTTGNALGNYPTKASVPLYIKIGNATT